MDPIKLNTVIILSIGSFLLHSLSSTLTTKAGFSLELIPRDSIYSPLYPGNLTDVERVRRLVNFSKSHARWIKSSIGRRDGVATVRPELIHYAGFFLVKVQIGPTPVHLLVDTGSSPIWTQIESCNPCFPQVEPKYNPNASPRYKPIPVYHPLCSHPVNGQCIINQG